MTTADLDQVRGCLLAGAAGDALGGIVEFDSRRKIHAQFGPAGVRDLVDVHGRNSGITDDTQMTLFTAEALIHAAISGGERRVELHHSYVRWFVTQGEAPVDPPGSSWLLEHPVLHARRAPGNTCLGALGSGRAGTTTEPINNSKGCGGVMRAAPAGFVGVLDAFTLGCDLAAITHGHPAGYLPAGVLASTVAHVVDGASLDAALVAAREELRGRPDHEETLAALDAGIALGRAGLPTGEDLERLGGGWTGEEALAIAVACVLGAPSLEEAIVAAVNHDGDSDSTGSIAGNLLGAVTGVSAIPRRWLDHLEATDIIEQMAADLCAVLGPTGPTAEVRARHGSPAGRRFRA